MAARDDYPLVAMMGDPAASVAIAKQTRDALDEIDRLRRWRVEACIALGAATTIAERHGLSLNLGNHDRLIEEARTS